MKSTSSLLLTAAQVTTAVAVTIGCTWNIVISSLLNQIKESVNNSLWVTKSSVITNIEEIIEKQFVQLIGIFLVLLIPFVICLAVATFLQVLYFFSALLSNVKTAVKKVESGVQQVGDSGAGVIAGKNIEWKRPNQFLQNPVFVQNGFTIDDICQGSIGDCYLIAAIACLTTRQHLLLKIIGPYDMVQGTYSFRFYNQNSFQTIVINDELPTTDNKLIFSRSNDTSEIWCALLEKAYATFKGGYDNIAHGGLPQDALQDMCGGKKFLVCLKEKWGTDVDVVWENLCKYHSRGALMVCFRYDKYNANMTGLHDKHAYTILDVIETYDNSNRKRLVQLRNPWGYFEWKGAHSDGCQSWTDNLKHMLALRVENGDVVSPTNY